MIKIILSVLIGITTIGCYSQSDRINLTNEELNKILLEVDTLEGINNYHVLIKSEDNEVFQVYIWINKRLGETMFKEAKMDICRFYNLSRSMVFVYSYKECEINVPSKFIRKESEDQYSHLQYSPFFVENGFHKSLLIKKLNSKLEITDLEIIENKKLIEEIKSDIDY